MRIMKSPPLRTQASRDSRRRAAFARMAGAFLMALPFLLQGSGVATTEDLARWTFSDIPIGAEQAAELVVVNTTSQRVRLRLECASGAEARPVDAAAAQNLQLEPHATLRKNLQEWAGVDDIRRTLNVTLFASSESLRAFVRRHDAEQGFTWVDIPDSSLES
jgi:hypothetical protein